VLGTSCIAGQLQQVDAQAMGNMMYGMQGMSSDVPEVRSVLGMLPRLLGSFKEWMLRQWEICCTVCRA
jgi:hypothetical protein